MARATAHVRSFWKFFHFVNQFPRPARKNGHPVLSSRFLSRVLVITISRAQIKRLNCSIVAKHMTSQTAPDWQLQIGESGASSRYNFNMELERLVCKQTALAA